MFVGPGVQFTEATFSLTVHTRSFKLQYTTPKGNKIEKGGGEGELW
jgi:hypothetical protein